MTVVLVLAEHDRGELADATLEAMTFARTIPSAEISVLVCGDHDFVEVLAAHGAASVHVAEHDVLATDFGPDAWGQTLAAWIEEHGPEIVVACGTSKGNEVLAHAAARLDLPFVANCIELSDGGRSMTRVQWGGSLLEQATLEAEIKIVSVAHHAIEATPGGAVECSVETFEPELDDAAAVTIVRRREIAEAGITLATAPLVVGGGRAVGGADEFGPLEELAALLGGRVGCSRAVTNNGWRPHADQVGQTGTRIAPELYIASGISGAIQHWVGAMASKQILAINTDPSANMVVKADYAVIGDLHEVIPAIIAEVESRRR